MEQPWQDVLDRFSYGIYLVTLVAEGKDNGMIASWVAQCSHEPPMVTLAIRKDRLSHEQINQTKRFCINVLPDSMHKDLVRFKSPDWHHKFDGLEYHRSQQGLPVLAQSVGYLDCIVMDTNSMGDHTLFIGHVISGRFLNDVSALTTAHYGGVYRGDT